MALWALVIHAAETVPYAAAFNGRTVALQPARCSAYPLNQVWPGFQRPIEQTAINWFATFDIDKPGEFRLTVPGLDGGEVLMRPMSEAARCRVTGDVVTVAVSTPGQFTLEFGPRGKDSRFPMVHVFANPPFHYAHVPYEIYFGPGEHDVGVVAPTNGQTVCLAEGAVVYGSLFVCGAKDVKVVGRGVFDGSRIDRSDPESAVDRLARSKGLAMTSTADTVCNCFTAYGATNLTVEGVTFRDSASWTVKIRGHSRNVTLDNIKIVGQWRYNSDGINCCACENMTVRNSFVRSYDDCIVARAAAIKGDDGAPLKNFLVENCVLWCDWGKNLEVWAGKEQSLIEKVRYRNCKLVNVSGVACDITTWYGSSDTRIADVAMEDIEIDLPRPRYSMEIRNKSKASDFHWREQGEARILVVDCDRLGRPRREQEVTNDADTDKYRLQYENLVFRNFTFYGEDPAPRTAKVETKFPTHDIKGVTIENIPGLRTSVRGQKASGIVEVVGDWQLRIWDRGETATFAIDPPDFVDVKHEPQKNLKTKDSAVYPWTRKGDSPSYWGWVAGNRLERIKACECTVRFALVPDSVRVTKADGTLLKDGVDYELEPTWGAIARLKEGVLAAGETVFVDYRYGRQRLDRIVRTADGRLVYRKGVPDTGMPRQPDLAAGETPVATVWTDAQTKRLTDANVFPTLEADYTETTDDWTPGAAQLCPNTYRKLVNGDKVRILAWGDSVTNGGYLPEAERWQYQFLARLRARFPKAEIELVSKGWGGRGSMSFRTAPPGHEFNYREVVLAPRYDLVVMEFVNDCGKPPHLVEKEYAEILTDFRRAGSEWCILTPHYTRADWMGMPSQKHCDADPRPYVGAVRNFCRTNGVLIADASRRWGRLWRQGVPYKTLLVNDINHPNRAGMKIFVDALMAKFAVRSELKVTDFGARPDGSLCTEAFRRAIAAAAERGGRVVVPKGAWVTGAIHLRSNVEFHLEDGAKIVFTDVVEDYLPLVRSSFSCMEYYGLSPLLYAYGCTNVSVTGKGTFAPRMGLWRSWFNRNTPEMFAAMGTLYGWGENDEPVENRRVTHIPGAKFRPCCIEFERCRNVNLDGFRVRESPCWTVHLRLCEDVTVRNLDLKACGHNNDGIDIDASRRVLVEGCRLVQGDDGFVIKSGRDRDGRRVGVAVEDVEIRNCTLTAGHALLTIGSEVAGGVRNICIHDCRADGPVSRLVSIKTSDRKGAFIENVVASNLTAQCVNGSVVGLRTNIDFQWGKYPAREHLVTRIDGIRVENVRCESAGRFYELAGDPRLPPTNVVVRNITTGELLKDEGSATNVNGLVCADLKVVADPARQVKKGIPGYVAPIYPYINQDHVAVYSETVADWPQLRGVHLPVAQCTDETFSQLKAWGATLVRLEETPFRPLETNDMKRLIAEYHRFVDARREVYKPILARGVKYGIKIAVHLPEPCGRFGETVKGHHRQGDSRILWEPQLQEAFVRAWARTVNHLHYRCADIATAIYGYDIINEPEQKETAPCDYWTLQRRVAEAIRGEDAETPILIEAGLYDSPKAFGFLSPMKIYNVIYQVHMYAPHAYTHQLHPKAVYDGYPNAEKGWNLDFLRQQLKPVVDFQRRHGCRIYVGEFSAIGWAPGADRYLADCIGLFKEFGWDWTYHSFREWSGWSVEHEGPGPGKMEPTADTPRKRVLLEGLRSGNSVHGDLVWR